MNRTNKNFSKKVYIVRSVDLQLVAYSDTVFRTLKEAREEIQRRTRVDSYVDVLIRITVNSEDIYENLLNDELDTYDTIEDVGEVEFMMVRKGI